MPSPPPNILLIVADDMGVDQLGSALGGGGFFETPCLERFAAGGACFHRAYATAPVCSPARASLYTGQHPARLHLTEFIPGSTVRNPRLLTPPWQRGGLPVSAVTLGDALKAGGYATAHFGKWHLAADYNHAPGRPMDPESQGFDEVVPTLKPTAGADPEPDPHHIERLTDLAIAYCRRPQARPFFCVLAHNALHRPELAPAALVAKYAAKAGADPAVHRPALGAMVEQLDRSIGRLLDGLAAAGRDRDTLVVFTADHGAYGPRDRPTRHRGAKADLYEGGLRVPLLFRWPGQIAAGTVCGQLVSGADIFPTLLAAAGARADGPLDGVNLGPILWGTTETPPHAALYWHYPHYHHLGVAPCAAVRVGDFKLIEWFEAGLGAAGAMGPACELFNLANDPGETRDLAAAEPRRCEVLRRQLREWRQAVGAQEMSLNPNYDPNVPTELAPPPG